MKELERLSNYLKSLGDEWYETEEWKNLSKGERQLVRIYNSNQYEKNRENSWYKIVTDELFIDDFLWEDELEDLYKAMKKMDIKQFIYVDNSTGCMNTLNFFINKGCKITGNEVYETEEEVKYKEGNEIRTIIGHQGLVITL